MSLNVTGITPLISVWDMPEAIAFYRDRLGFAVIASSPEIEAPEGRYFHWAWLRRGGAEVMLNTAYDAGERPAARDPARRAAHADTYLYIGCEDVDAVHADLCARGLNTEPPRRAPYGMRQIFLRDPDGYTLCFQTPA